MLFRRIVLCALLVGALCGLLASVVQQWQVIPIIEAAEALESRALPSAPPELAAPAHGAGHAHADEPFMPEDGMERELWTLIANALTATGFALLLIPLIAAAERLQRGPAATARNGLGWGAAGWLCVFVAPALGLPPEIPGAAAAALHERQAWWLLAVVCAASGIAVLRFVPTYWRWLGLGLLALPYAVGAPELGVGPFSGYDEAVVGEMEALAHRFAWATAIANAIGWLALGSLSSVAVARWVRPALDATLTGMATPAVVRARTS
ncbi:MAG: CbtA family protein [Rhodocyclales bacterium]|nr:CbtA family protein [Rhodocyclales bacterium]